MTKYIIGEIFSSGRATLYKNSSDQTVPKSSNQVGTILVLTNMLKLSMIPSKPHPNDRACVGKSSPLKMEKIIVEISEVSTK